MARLAQTDGLTDVQKEILAAVKTFVDKEISRTPRSWSTRTSSRRRSSTG